MATVDTPIKVSNTGCVICLDSSPSRSYKLVSQKCTSSNVFKKLKWLLSRDLEEDLLKDKLICRPCLNKLNTFWDFKDLAVESFESSSSRTYVKRGHVSPLTPKSTESNVTFSPEISSTPVKSKKKSRKALSSKFDLPGVHLPPPAADVSDIHPLHKSSEYGEETVKDHPSDHDYFTAPTEANAKVEECDNLKILKRHGVQWNPDFQEDVIQRQSITDLPFELHSISNFVSAVKNCDKLYNAIKKEILLDLHSSVCGLASRTVQFQSAMLKFRDLNKLEDVEFFFNQLLTEMEER